MKYYNSMQELIGNTPLVKLGNSGLPKGVNLFAKLELMNPAGSVKDRIGREMIADAEARGVLKAGGTIVEGTAGNTGLGIAFAALEKGYRVIFVVPTKFSQEKQTLMRALGAEIVNTPREEGMLGAAKKQKKSAIQFRGQLRWSSLRILQIRVHIIKLPGRRFTKPLTEKLTTLLPGLEAAELMPVL